MGVSLRRAPTKARVSSVHQDGRQASSPCRTRIANSGSRIHPITYLFSHLRHRSGRSGLLHAHRPANGHDRSWRGRGRRLWRGHGCPADGRPWGLGEDLGKSADKVVEGDQISCGLHTRLSAQKFRKREREGERGEWWTGSTVRTRLTLKAGSQAAAYHPLTTTRFHSPRIERMAPASILSGLGLGT